MGFEFTFPDVGEGITEGEIVKWLVKPGDVVKEDQIVVKVETDKAVADIPSPQSGIVTELRVKEGETVQVGQTIMVLGGKGEKVKKEPASVKKPKKEKSVSVVGFLEEAEDVVKGKKKVFEKKKPTAPVNSDVKALPKVRKLAEELKVKLNTIKGTGKDGVITIDDVKKAVRLPSSSAQKKVRKYDMWGYVERVPLKGMRKTIAKNMVKSATETASVTHMDEADITDLVSIREKEKAKAKKQGIKLTYLPFVLKALVGALKEHPYMNSTLETQEDGSAEIVIKKYYNIGIGVDTPDGLMVFVVKGVDMKNMLELAKDIDDLATKARERSINMGDLKGGTFTVTNYGSLGGIFGTPVINPGECAILGVGKILEKPLVVGGKVEVRKVLPLSLTFDHRIVDGAEVALFMNKLIEYLEDPDLLLLEQ